MYIENRFPVLTEESNSFSEEPSSPSIKNSILTPVCILPELLTPTAFTPSKESINQLVTGAISSSFVSSPVSVPGLFGQRRAFSFQPLAKSSFFSTNKEAVDIRKKLTRAQSESAMTIKTAVEKSVFDYNYIIIMVLNI